MILSCPRMRFSTRWYALLLATLLLSACDTVKQTPAQQADGIAAPAQTSQTQATTAKTSSDVERPTLKIATLDHGMFDLATKHGRWVVVNFWATWCSPCLKEMPELDAFDTAQDDVDVIGLAYEEIAPDEMRAFLQKHPVRYPIALIDTYNPPADFPTPRGLPMTYVIAPDGSVAETFMGPVTQNDLAVVIGRSGNTADGGKANTR